MSWTPQDLYLRIAFASAMIGSLVIMKAVSLSAAKDSKPSIGFWVSPLASVVSWNNSPPVNRNSLRYLTLNTLIGVVALVFIYWSFFRISTEWDLKGIALGYLAVIPAFVLGEVGLAPFRLVCALTGRIIPKVHRRILFSRSIGEFWGNYNTWISDWFLQVLFKPLRRNPIFASFVVFAFSGLWHEAVITVPLQMIFGINRFGYITLYFFIQWILILFDRAFLKELSIFRRIFMLISVVGPAPLFLNEGFLRVFGWWR